MIMKCAVKLPETAAAELRAGRHGPAGCGLKKLLKSRPRDPVARHLLGLIHPARGEAGSTAGQFRLAVDAEVNVALALVADGVPGEAEHVLRSKVEKTRFLTGALRGTLTLRPSAMRVLQIDEQCR